MQQAEAESRKPKARQATNLQAKSHKPGSNVLCASYFSFPVNLHGISFLPPISYFLLPISYLLLLFNPCTIAPERQGFQLIFSVLSPLSYIKLLTACPKLQYVATTP
jgi:hypothetical protein